MISCETWLTSDPNGVSPTASERNLSHPVEEIEVTYGDANGVKYVGPRQILYSYIYDITVSDLKNAYVATSDIQPKNGVVHVLRMTDHDFGFDRRLFALKAIEEGIDELSQINKTE